MGKNLSTKFFILSMCLILFGGLGAILFSSYLLNNHHLPNLYSSDGKESGLLVGGPVTKKPVTISLNLSSPDNNILVFTPDLLIQGKTTPGSIVLISLDTNDQILDVNKDGNFSITIKLKDGVNNLLISSFDSIGNSASETRTIYYSTDKL